MVVVKGVLDVPASSSDVAGKSVLGGASVTRSFFGVAVVVCSLTVVAGESVEIVS